MPTVPPSLVRSSSESSALQRSSSRSESGVPEAVAPASAPASPAGAAQAAREALRTGLPRPGKSIGQQLAMTAGGLCATAAGGALALYGASLIDNFEESGNASMIAGTAAAVGAMVAGGVVAAGGLMAATMSAAPSRSPDELIELVVVPHDSDSESPRAVEDPSTHVPLLRQDS